MPFPTLDEVVAIEAELDQVQTHIDTAYRYALMHSITAAFETELARQQKWLDDQRLLVKAARTYIRVFGEE